MGLFSFFKKEGAKPPLPRICEVGWVVDTPSSGMIYPAPRSLNLTRDKSQKPPRPSPKGVNFCPALIDAESKTFHVTAPIDLHIVLGRDDKGQLVMQRPKDSPATVNLRHLDKLLTLLSPDRWRAPDKPVIQLLLPYRFIADEPVWINQLPPYGEYIPRPWPGVMVTGRFPVDIWPRPLMWAFEWHDTTKELYIRRGEPLFYVRFETTDPDRPIRLVEAEMTPELRQYCNSIDGVTNYVSRTFSLFNEARKRRPQKLLKKAERVAPEAE